MKIIDVPQTGKIGLQVSMPGRYGLVRRAWVVPANPNTLAQQTVRANLTAQAKAYDALTDAQQAAWESAASLVKSRATLGQSGPLTGLQLFTKINCSLLAINGEPVTDPPAIPQIDVLPITGLEITNTANVIAIKLVTTDSPPEGTMLWGGKPANSGVRRAPSMRLLGTLDSPVANRITITTAYTGEFGVPAVGQRVFVQCNANVSGFEGPRYTFSARVPTSS